MAECPAEKVLVLSSHTSLESRDALAKLADALDDPKVACASSPWDDDQYYSDAITWNELRSKGLKIGSIYSNSFGLLRRSLWEEVRFDEQFPTMEDYAWAIAQLKRGYVCRRSRFQFGYQRSSKARNFIFTACAFKIAAQYKLPVRWSGRKECVKAILRLTMPTLLRRATREEKAERALYVERLLASIFWRFNRATSDC